MNLVIDQGNTNIKYGIFDQNKIILSEFRKSVDDNWLNNLVANYQIKQSLISSVTSDGVLIFQKIKNKIPFTIFFNNTTKLPFKNLYQTPETLGKDRLAVVAGAIEIAPNTPLLVIDAGTALTIEFVNEKMEYLGGNISPGLNLRFKSLHQFTSKLPLLEQTSQFELFGNSTNKAIISGVQNSIIFEIDEYIDRQKQHFGTLKTFITGGDAEFFAGKLKNPIFVDQNLVLKGLNRILKYNA